MINSVVRYHYFCPLAYCSKGPAHLQLTKGPISVVLAKKNSHYAKVHSNDHAKVPKCQQKETI